MASNSAAKTKNGQADLNHHHGLKQQHLPSHLREQIIEANKLEFPEAQFAFKDIPFPDVNHYKKKAAFLKAEREASRAAQGFIYTKDSEAFAKQDTADIFDPISPRTQAAKKKAAERESIRAQLEFE